MLLDPLLRPDNFIIPKFLSPFFVHSEYKDDHTYFLAFTGTFLFNYLKFANKKIEYLHFRNFDWLTKIAHILDGDGCLLKKIETIISVLEISIGFELYFILI